MSVLAVGIWEFAWGDLSFFMDLCRIYVCGDLMTVLSMWVNDESLSLFESFVIFDQ